MKNKRLESPMIRKKKMGEDVIQMVDEHLYSNSQL